MDKLKIGFIGCGGIAFDKHFPGMATQRDRIEMYAFCDIIPERAEEARQKYGCEGAKVFTDYRELLACPEIYAVHVLTPNVKHCEISCAAMEAGKHVICEKPMAATYADAMKMYETHQRTGKLLTIGYQYRHFDMNKAMKQYVDTGALGEIYYAEATAWRRRGIPTWGVFTNKAEQGGGPLIDMATHALDLTLWMMNNYKPKCVMGTTYHKLNNDKRPGNAWGDWDPAKFTVEDSAFGFVVMENGATIQVNASWALNTLDVEEATTTLSGTKAGADMHDGLTINGVTCGRQYALKPDFRAGGAAFYSGSGAGKPEDIENRIFLKAVRGEGELCVLPEQAATVTRILDAIYESARTGKPVYFD